MATATRAERIEALMEEASAALGKTRYHEAERLAAEALELARKAEAFERMARICLPLQECRRQRYQEAIAAAEGGAITIIDEPVDEETFEPRPGFYFVRPPEVGATARRLRLLAFDREISVGVVCREPKTDMGLVPIVAIGPGGAVRVKVRPPKDPDAPSLEWLIDAMEALGDMAIDTVDAGEAAYKRVDTLAFRLDAIPEHERLHQALLTVCAEAVEEAAAGIQRRRRR